MMGKYVDLEKGCAAVEPEESWLASDDYIPGPGCVFGVLFGCFSLMYVVVILVAYGPWPALGMAAVSAVLDYVVVLGARSFLAVNTSITEAHQQPKTTAGQDDRTSNRTRKLNPYFNGYIDWEN